MGDLTSEFQGNDKGPVEGVALFEGVEGKQADHANQRRGECNAHADHHKDDQHPGQQQADFHGAHRAASSSVLSSPWPETVSASFIAWVAASSISGTATGSSSPDPIARQ